MPASRRPAQRRPRLRLPSPANARIRAKLGLILLVPIAAILVLTSLRLFDAGSRATDANRVGTLTRLSANVSALSHQVDRERMAAARYLAATDPKTPEAVAAKNGFETQTKNTDVAIGGYNAQRGKVKGVSAAVDTALDRIDQQLATVATVRRQISDRSNDVSVDQAILRYGVIVDDLTAYRQSLGQVTDDPGLADELQAAAAFSKAKASLGDEQALAFELLTSSGSNGETQIDAQEYSAFVATLTAQQEAFATFALTASPEQKQVVNSSITGDAVVLGDEVTDKLRGAPTGPSGVKVNDALGALGAVDDLMRFAEQEIDSDLVGNAADVSSSVQRQALLESVVIVLVLGLVIALALIMARSMIGSLRRLRQSAIAVAEFDLPDTVGKLRDAQNVGQDTPDQLAAQVRDPIELDTKDEIGEVARAFNMVHREAVRVAAEQAVLRTSVSAMFLGLARRSQTLVDRMIGQLDRIERTEEDPKRLAELFQLDHLATRMRRNDENVLVLADSDSTPPRRDDAPLMDVMRAAQSEIEMYQRVEFGTLDEDVQVAAHAVNDVVRLLAELLDNATRFSPPTGIVVLEARRLGDRVLIQIEDGGLGMSSETLADYNRRLSAPPALDPNTFRMMGLAVVGRLAHRHGIVIQLRDRSGSGTIVEVLLPAAALILPKVRAFRQLPPETQINPGAGQAPFGGQPAAPAGPAGLSRSGSFPTIGGGGSGSFPAVGSSFDHSTTAAMPVVSAPPQQSGPPSFGPPLPQRPMTPPPTSAPPMSAPPTSAPPSSAPPSSAPPAPAQSPARTPAPPQWPMPSAPVSPAGVPAANRWADLLTEPYIPDGPGTDKWQLHDDTTELPIFREIEAGWFAAKTTTMPEVKRPEPATVAAPSATAASTSAPSAVSSAASSAPSSTGAPKASPAPQPAAASAGPTRPASPTPPSRPASTPPPTSNGDNPWRTRADDGWAAARAAAEPPVAGTTRSGLPKRSPQAQLVPGGVNTEQAARPKRTPDEVRGLLSSYHRGVRRGRAATGADGGNTDGGFPPMSKGNNA
jgi:signal transduction histidine kinase